MLYYELSKISPRTVNAKCNLTRLVKLSKELDNVYVLK